jgi:hypothetical protein
MGLKRTTQTHREIWPGRRGSNCKVSEEGGRGFGGWENSKQASGLEQSEGGRERSQGRLELSWAGLGRPHRLISV